MAREGMQPGELQANVIRAVADAEDVWRQIRAGDYEAWSQFSDACRGYAEGDKHCRLVIEMLLRAAAMSAQKGEA